jgi:hypothetical protein
MAVWGAEFPLVTEKADGGVVAAEATGYGSPVYEALRETAFHERRKNHDLIMEGIDAVLKKRRYASVQQAMTQAGRARPLTGVPRRAAEPAISPNGT